MKFPPARVFVRISERISARIPACLSTLALLAAGAIVGSAPAPAQAYPEKAVTIVVPYATGGSVDVVARMLADELRKSLNQPFLVENRVGAYGNIAAAHVAKASPDGYTLLVHNAAAVASSASAFKSLTFNPRTDFAPVAIVAHQPGVLVVNPALPVKSVKDFIDYARTKAGKLNYGVGGIFGPTHTPAVLFEMKTGIKAEAVMYKGAAPAIVDLVGGQIDFMFDTAPTSLPHISTGRLRPIAVTSAKRLEGLPDVPTVSEGGVAGYEFNSWIGMTAPAGTPEAVISRLNGVVNRMLADPAFQKRLKDYGLEPSPQQTPAQFGQFVREETDLYAQIIKASGIDPL